MASSSNLSRPLGTDLTKRVCSGENIIPLAGCMLAMGKGSDDQQSSTRRLRAVLPSNQAPPQGVLAGHKLLKTWRRGRRRANKCGAGRPTRAPSANPLDPSYLPAQELPLA